MTRTPYKFTARRPANCLATACNCFSTGLQSCATASLPLQNCLPVRTTVTSESGPLAGLPSQGPGSPSDPEGPCRRRHGQAGWRGGSRAGRPAGATIDIYCNYVQDYNDAAGIAVKTSCFSARGLGSNSCRGNFLLLVFCYVHTNVNLYIPCMYLVYVYYE